MVGLLPPHHHATFLIHVLQSKHTLTEQEDAECRECFNLFDRDKDGKISISELGLIMRSLGRAPTELEVKDYMKSIDKGSGSFDIGGLLDVRPDIATCARFLPTQSLHSGSGQKLEVSSGGGGGHPQRFQGF